jgi:hypothetical protein
MKPAWPAKVEVMYGIHHEFQKMVMVAFASMSESTVSNHLVCIPIWFRYHPLNYENCLATGHLNSKPLFLWMPWQLGMGLWLWRAWQICNQHAECNNYHIVVIVHSAAGGVGLWACEIGAHLGALLVGIVDDERKTTTFYDLIRPLCPFA